MTVSTPTNKVSYIGNGVATSFAIPFPFLEKDHLNVYQLLNDIQTERTDWTVSDGNMVFETAPAENAQIVIMRDVPLTQETDYRENEILSAETLERCFDKLTMQVQQLKEQTERAVTVDIFDDTDAAELIPSIRQSVSDAATYVETAQTNAQSAANKAQEAAVSAENAAASFIATQTCLTEKANKNLSNAIPSTEFIKTAMSWLMPNWSCPQTITTLNFTAPTKGWIVGQNIGTASYKINQIHIGGCAATAGWSSRGNMQILVDEGDVLTLENADFNQPHSLTFLPCKGETETETETAL